MKIRNRWWILGAGLLFLCGGSGCFPSDRAAAAVQDSGEETESQRHEDTVFESAALEIRTDRQENDGQVEEDQREQGQAPKSVEEQVEEYIQSMTLEEKAAQLFIVFPEALIEGVDCVTAAGETTRKAIQEIPIGGFIYLDRNLQSESQVKSMLENTQNYSMERLGLPAFLCVDEEGGSVARIGGREEFDVPVIGDMARIGAAGDVEAARKVGEDIGTYLSRMGFNVDFAPVADVWSNPENQVVKRRSFGADPKLVSEMTSAVSEGLHSKGVLSVYKHFPGHGATAGDTHKGYAYTEKTEEQLKSCELIPFQRGIREKVPFIMTGHVSLPGLTGDDTPASLSPAVIGDLLRKDMGYDGIVVTDALNMGAVVQQYSSGEAAVKALKAGADILLMPYDFKAAYRGVLEAVESGELSRERIDESIRRILRVKIGWSSTENGR